MKYSIRLAWNGTDVLEGKCTLVAGFDIGAAFLRENFAGVDHKRWCEGYLAFAAAQRELETRGYWCAAYSDETGIAAVEILPL